MELKRSTNANINYLAKVINITNFEPHPNADKMKIAAIGGYKVCVGINEPEGRYVYFPVNCTINSNLLSFCNLYRHGIKNSDPNKIGFFEDNGRVTAIKLRGFPSEGFLLPYSDLENFIQSTLNKKLNSPEDGFEFDSIVDGPKESWICKKYIVQSRQSNISIKNSKQKNVSKFDKIIEDQFRFHYDTCQVKKEPWCIEPNDLISITSKIHGTSTIHAYVLCKKQRNWWQNIIDRILDKEPLIYDYIYSSRSVIKNKSYNETVTGGFYGCDVWAEADKVIRPHLIKGMTIYAEIVGFLPTGSYIQKNYDYGCIPPKEGEVYTHEKHFKVRVYRITLTNTDGIVHEFSAREVQQWCKNNHITPVTEYYYGFAGDLYPQLKEYINGSPVYPENWNELFWNELANDATFAMEMDSPDCNNKVPHEGLVIKKEDMRSRAWKLKCFAFLNKEQQELDKGIENIEDNA